MALNDMQNVFRDMPAMRRLMNVLLNVTPGQLISLRDLNSAMSELLTVYNRNTDKNLNLNPIQKEVAKVANYAFVSMVHESILSNMKVVALK